MAISIKLREFDMVLAEILRLKNNNASNLLLEKGFDFGH